MSNTPPSLLIRLRDSRDATSWQRFFEQYWRLIYAFARRCGLSLEDAEDVLQEVVTEVYRAMPTFEYDRSRGTFRAYLRTITQRKVTDHLRKKARGRSACAALAAESGNGHAQLADPAGRAAEETWERDWQRNLLQICINHVRDEVEPKTFQAFQLYALDGWSAADSARFLGVSTATVYMAKSRVTQRSELATNGIFNQTSIALLAIELSELASGRVTSSGSISLDGALLVSLDEAYEAGFGDAFAILSGASVTGMFSSVDLPELSNGLSLDLRYESDAVWITVVPEPATALALLLLTVIPRRRRW
jgi:RNA polymerase sigma-70 factor (ECF subfamily)